MYEGCIRVKRQMVAVPPVCHAAWTEKDWAAVTRVVEEPDEIRNGLGVWQWTGTYDENERKLYKRISSEVPAGF
jgi:hypothetical protein